MITAVFIGSIVMLIIGMFVLGSARYSTQGGYGCGIVLISLIIMFTSIVLGIGKILWAFAQ